MFRFSLLVFGLLSAANSIYTPTETTTKPPYTKTIWRKIAFQPKDVNLPIIMHHNYSKVYVNSQNSQVTQNQEIRQPKIFNSSATTYSTQEIFENKPYTQQITDQSSQTITQYEQNFDSSSTYQSQHQTNVNDKLLPLTTHEDSLSNINYEQIPSQTSHISTTYQKNYEPSQIYSSQSKIIHDKLSPLNVQVMKVDDKLLPMETNQQYYKIDPGISNHPNQHEINVFGFHYPPRPDEIYPFKTQTYSNMAFEQCPQNATGQLAYLWSCSQYLNCWKGRGFVQNCAPGTMFNPETLECDYEHKVNCISGPHNQKVRFEKSFTEENSCKPNFSGLIPHSSDCTKFINCANGQAYIQDCGPGTAFNPKILACDYPHVTGCDIRQTVSETDSSTPYPYVLTDDDIRMGGQYGGTHQNYRQSIYQSGNRIDQGQQSFQQLPTLKEYQNQYAGHHQTQFNQNPVPNQQPSWSTRNCDPNCQKPNIPTLKDTTNQQNIYNVPTNSDGQVHTIVGTNCGASQNCQPQHQQQLYNTNQQRTFVTTSHAQNCGINCQPNQQQQQATFTTVNTGYNLNCGPNNNCQSIPKPSSPVCKPPCVQQISNSNQQHVRDYKQPNIQTNQGTYIIQNTRENTQCNSGNCQPTYTQQIPYINQGPYIIQNTRENKQCNSGNCQSNYNQQASYTENYNQNGQSNQNIQTGTSFYHQQTQTNPVNAHIQTTSKIECHTGYTGLLPHPFICEKFLNCANGQTYIQDCGPGTVFNPVSKVCDWPYNVKCSNKNQQLQHISSLQNQDKISLTDQQNSQTQTSHNYFITKPIQNSGSNYNSQNMQTQIFRQSTTNPKENVHDLRPNYNNQNAETQATTHFVTNPIENTGQSYQNIQTGTSIYHQQTQTNPVNAHIQTTSKIIENSVECYTGYTGLLPHPFICEKFLNCANGRTYVQDCGPGTVFNPVSKVCDWPYNVKCTNKNQQLQHSSSLQNQDKISSTDQQNSQTQTSHNYFITKPTSNSGSNYNNQNIHPETFTQSTTNPKENVHDVRPNYNNQNAESQTTTHFVTNPLRNMLNFGPNYNSQNVQTQTSYNYSTTNPAHNTTPNSNTNYNHFASNPVYNTKPDSTDQFNQNSEIRNITIIYHNRPPVGHEQSALNTQHSQNRNNVTNINDKLDWQSHGYRGIIGYGKPPQYHNTYTSTENILEPEYAESQYNNFTQNYGFQTGSIHQPNNANSDQSSQQNNYGTPISNGLTTFPGEDFNIRQPTNNRTNKNIPGTSSFNLTTTVNVHENKNKKGSKHWPPPFPSTDTSADYYFEETTPETNAKQNRIPWKSSGLCPEGEFECSLHECIPQKWMCDGNQDCSNGNDEKHCTIYLDKFTMISNSRLFKHEIEKWLNTNLETCANYCLNSKSFKCKSFNYRRNEQVCLLCDTNVGLSGALAISNQYDYYEMSSETIDCSNMYSCSNKKCINFTQVCDGNNDCGNRMDEKNCSTEALDYSIRLANSQFKNEGRIEVKVFGEWGYVCDDQFDLRDADVVCKELGFTHGALEVKSGSFFAKNIKDNETFYLMDDVSCLGNETSLRDCDFSGWGNHNCMPQEIVGVVCKTPQETCPKDSWKCDSSKECLPLQFLCDGIFDCDDHSDEGSQHCEAPIELRLVNGTAKNEGRVEIRYHGVWGTICDDDFNDQAAKVICQSLGYHGNAVAKKEGAFGPGAGPIWLDQVNCFGNESYFVDCYHWNWGEHNCEHAEDAGVVCSNIDTSAYEKKSKTRESLDMEPVPAPTPDLNFSYKCGHRGDDLFLDESNENDDDVHFRVVQGSAARKGDYPWQATIRVRGKNKSSHWCGAVIISNKYVLTAAHCLVGFAKGSYLIRAGDYNIDENEGTEVEAFIEDYYVHEKFRQNGHMNNDIAIIKLKGAGLKLSKHVQPICLPDPNAIYKSGLNCTISGFGSTESGKSTSSRILRAGWVKFQTQEVCKMPQIYGTSITDGMFCAGSLEEGVDSCDGDSGGPLACLDKGLFTLYGITSWGQRCGHANKPGVYVKISYYRDWIDRIIKENS